MRTGDDNIETAVGRRGGWMRSRNGWLIGVIAVLVALALAVAGCGDDSEGGGESNGGAAATTAGQAKKPTGTPIKIMVIAPVETPVQDNPDIVAGAKAAALAINNDGGVKGRPIEIIFCNDRTDPNQATACARDAVKDKVTAVTGQTLFGAQAFPILEQAKIPVVGNVVTTPPDFESPIAYPILPGSVLMYGALPVALKEEGKRKIAGVALDLAAARALLDTIEAGTEAAGLEYVGGVVVPANASDYAPFVERAESLDPDAVVVALNEGTTIQFLRAAHQAASDLTFAHQTQAVGPDNIVDPLGDVGNGLLLAASLPPDTAGDDYPGIAQFNAEMDAAEDAGIVDADKRRWTTENAWLAVHAISTVAEQAKGTLDNESLIAALDAAKDVDLMGLVNWSPGAPGPKEYPRLSNGKVFFARIDDGEIVLDDKLAPIDVFDALGLSVPSGGS